MSFTPHTEAEKQAMLQQLGLDNIEQLFEEIPESLKLQGLNLNDPQTELALSRHMKQRAQSDEGQLNFIGAGAYNHHIPAAVWQVTSRGEFMTAYTPYQAEASQGALQTFYEYQTMMARLMAMDISNASLYDGASSLAESVLMAIRCHKRAQSSRRVLIPRTMHPYYRATVQTMVAPQSIELSEINYTQQGITDQQDLAQWSQEDVAAVVIPQPNFFGQLEEVDALTNWAHEHHALVIAVVNPLAMSLLPPPGEWGEHGADIVCGEGQPLGAPLAYGGPYFGFMCCRQNYLRHMPGRLIGRTTDHNGQPAYTMTLQPREQHIRRAKATSNICTNQGLLVIAATIYMSLMGTEGLQRVAAWSHHNTLQLQQALTAIPGVELVFSGQPNFHETVIRLPKDVDQVLTRLEQYGIQGGYALKRHFPELGNSLLVCATETKTQADIDQYQQTLQRVIEE